MVLKDKTDIELMAMVHEIETKMAQLQQAMQAVQAEVMRRINEFKASKDASGNDH